LGSASSPIDSKEEAMESIRKQAGNWLAEAKKNAGWLVGLGVLTVIAGFLAVAAPLASGLGVAVFVGAAVLVGGTARLIASFKAESFGQGAIAVLGGALAVIAGLIMMARPGLALATMTLMLAVYLLVDGVFGAIVAFGMRPQKGWGWMLFSAATGVLVGILLLREWPLTGMWAIGTLAGIHLMVSGFSMISIGSMARRLAGDAA